VDEYGCCWRVTAEFSVKCSGWYDTYCASTLSRGERVRRVPERGDWGGGGKDEVGAGSRGYDDGDDSRGVYVPEAGAGGAGIGEASGGRAVLGVRALVHSSSGSCDVVAAAAAAGEAYNADGPNDGGRGRGACRRGSGA